MGPAALLTRLPPPLRDRTVRMNRRRKPPADQIGTRRRYVLCWLQQALRGDDNPIVDVAITLGNSFSLPVVVYHGVDNRYPHATARLHHFILTASAQLQRDCERRRLRFVRYVRRPERIEPNLVRRLAAAAVAVVTDDLPTFVAPRFGSSVASQIDVPMFGVDAACLVPPSCFPDPLTTTRGFRAAHTPLRDRYLRPADVESQVRKFTGKLPTSDDLPGDIGTDVSAAIDTLICRCGIDLSLTKIDSPIGNRDAALNRMHDCITGVLPRYKWTRNNPSISDSTTGLSPAMHFGIIGPREFTAAIKAADLHSAARWKFLDELLTWREYYHHRARHQTDPASLANVPQRALDTLNHHRGDPRETTYSLDDLVHARTDDAVWNAAQRQFLLDGWMHNNLRMYWVKQFLRWRETPASAWAAAAWINDHLSLDGRDASTYGGLRWGFGESKRGYREIPIYGWVPPKSANAILKRTGMKDWIAEMNHRPMIQIHVDEGRAMRMYGGSTHP